MRSSANASLVPSIGTHPSRWPRHTVALEWTPNCFATQNTTQMRSSANAAAAPPAGAHRSRKRLPRHYAGEGRSLTLAIPEHNCPPCGGAGQGEAGEGVVRGESPY
jgi:hypothetical protein